MIRCIFRLVLDARAFFFCAAQAFRLRAPFAPSALAWRSGHSAHFWWHD
jgi:hypothetical protein